jgi:hypothetical protein
MYTMTRVSWEIADVMGLWRITCFSTRLLVLYSLHFIARVHTRTYTCTVYRLKVSGKREMFPSPALVGYTSRWGRWARSLSGGWGGTVGRPKDCGAREVEGRHMCASKSYSAIGQRFFRPLCGAL